eukprot:scaffold3513_cov127-Isochrysis_galbana.AAC.14
MTEPPLKNPGVLDAQRPHTLFFLLLAAGSDDGSWTGDWPQTGDALRRGQAVIRRSDRRTHLGDVAAHWATAARGATLTSAWSCLADACADGEMASH